MSLDIGELRNRLRSRSCVVPDQESEKPTLDNGHCNDPGLPKDDAPTKVLSASATERLTEQQQCESGDSRCNSMFKDNGDTQHDGGSMEKPPAVVAARPLPAKLKLSPFLGELNSRLQSRLASDGQKPDPALGLPNFPVKPKISPKPAIRPKPTTAPNTNGVCLAQSTTLPDPEVVSNTPACPFTTTVVGSATPAATCPEPEEPKAGEPQSCSQDDSEHTSKANFLQELKRKIFLGPRNPSEKGSKRSDRVADSDPAQSENKEDSVPTLTHSCAKHRLLIRPKKAYRMTYADFRKSRLLQLSNKLCSQECGSSLGIIESEPQTEISNSIEVSGELKEDLRNISNMAVLENVIASSVISTEERASIESPDSPTSGEPEELSSPGGSSDDTASFHTPPESPSCSSELGQSESITDADFFSVSSELTFDGLDMNSVASEVLPDSCFISELESAPQIPSLHVLPSEQLIPSDAKSSPSMKQSAFMEHCPETVGCLAAPESDVVAAKPDPPAALSVAVSGLDSFQCQSGSTTSGLPTESLAVTFNKQESLSSLPSGEGDFDHSPINKEETVSPQTVPDDTTANCKDQASPCAPCGSPRQSKARAARLKLQHEIEVFEMKEHPDTENSLHVSSSDPQVLDPTEKNGQDGKTTEKELLDMAECSSQSTCYRKVAVEGESAFGELPEQQVDPVVREDKDARGEQWNGDFSKPTGKSVKAAAVESDSRLITEEMDDFVLVDLNKEKTGSS